MQPLDLAAIILAGGKATRLGGIAKHAIVVDGKPILERLLDVLRPRCGEIVVASNAPIEGVRVVGDARPGMGPLGGVAAGLAAVSAPWAIVVAGDMPFVTGKVIDRLIAAAFRPEARSPKPEASPEAVAFRVDGRPEPLCCALRVSAARPVVEGMLAEGRLRASDLLAALQVEWLDVASGSEEAAAFANLNSPGDLPPGSGI